MTTYAELAEDLQDREHAKIANNTYAHRIGPDLITVTLHGSTILRFSSAGSISATDAGYPTKTTVQRLNAFTPDRFLFTMNSVRGAGIEVALRSLSVFVIDQDDDSPTRIPLHAVECLLPDAGRGCGVVINIREGQTP